MSIKFGTTENPEFELNTYGAFDDFYLRIDNDPFTNLDYADDGWKYRVLISYFYYDGSSVVEVELPYEDIEPPLGQTQTYTPFIYYDPLKRLRDTVLASDKFSADMDYYDPLGQIKVRFQVGFIDKATPTSAPTFNGYIYDKSAYFFRGKLGGVAINQPLPLIQSTLSQSKYFENQAVISAVTLLNIDGLDATTGVNIKSFNVNQYDSDGVFVSSTAEDFTIAGDPGTTEIPSHGIVTRLVEPTETGGYAEANFTYQIYDTGVAPFYDTDVIKVYQAECYPKADECYLRWVNQLGGWEQCFFQNLVEESVSMKRGKLILQSGIDSGASDLDDLKSSVTPNYKRYGDQEEEKYRAVSNYLRQEQLDALADLYKSPIVVMIYDGKEFPVLVEDSSYTIQDVKRGLQKVEVNVRLANIKKLLA